MPISWNEIRQNAIVFSREWAGEAREEAEAKTFWDEFFKVFGIKRRTVARFEEPVKKLTGKWGFADESFEFPLADLHHHVDKFAFIPGYKQHKLEDQSRGPACWTS